MKGSVVIDEIVFPIIDLRLRAGVLQIVAYAHGPLRAGGGEATEVHIFGEDGEVVTGARQHRVGWPSLTDTEEMDVIVPIRMMGEE